MPMQVHTTRSEQTRRAVDNGVALMDKAIGRGWELLIDLATFRISRGDRCVLGQVFAPLASTEEGEPDGYSLAVRSGDVYDYGTLSAEESSAELAGYLNGFLQDVAFEGGWTMQCGFFTNPEYDRAPTWDQLQREWEERIAGLQARWGDKAQVAALRAAIVVRMREAA